MILGNVNSFLADITEYDLEYFGDQGKNILRSKIFGIFAIENTHTDDLKY